MEVKFRIGEQVDKIAGGEVDDPHHGISNPSHEIEKTIQADWLVRRLPLVLVSYDYLQYLGSISRLNACNRIPFKLP